MRALPEWGPVMDLFVKPECKPLLWERPHPRALPCSLLSVCWCCAYTLSIAASCKSVQQQYFLGASHQLFLTSSVWVTSLGFLGSVLSLWSNKNPNSLQLRRIAFRRLRAGGIEAETIMASALLSACSMRLSASTGAPLPPRYLVSCSSTPTNCVAAPQVLWPQSHVWIVSRIGIFLVLVLLLVPPDWQSHDAETSSKLLAISSFLISWRSRVPCVLDGNC
jgi:hypothetical protein